MCAASEVVVIDYGSQYTENIQRFFRERMIPVEIQDFDSPEIEGAKGVILSGGPYSVYGEGMPELEFDVIKAAKRGTQVLGLCYGHQLIAKELGGRVEKGSIGEYGFTRCNFGDHWLFNNAKSNITWMSHGDQVTSLPSGFRTIASTEDCPVAAYAHYELPIYGLQFHPEVSHTVSGESILSEFARRCGCEEKPWDVNGFIRETEDYLARTVGDDCIVSALSGGVDSSGLAVMLHRSLGERAVLLHVDHGLNRKDESRRVVSEFKRNGIQVIFKDESEVFLSRLQGVEDANEQRLIIGRTFYDVIGNVMEDYGTKKFAYGTLASDRIESSRGRAVMDEIAGKKKHGGKIKMHHNRVKPPAWMERIEPFTEIYKYQMRMVSREILGEGFLLEGNPIYQRQPFPGPGLALRCRLPLKRGTLDTLREVTPVVEDAFEPYNPSQYFAIMVPGEVDYVSDYGPVLKSKAVGVKGDEGVVEGTVVVGDYGEMDYYDTLRFQQKITGSGPVCRVALLTGGKVGDGWGVITRAVDSKDYMTARPTQIPMSVHRGLAKEILEMGASFTAHEITTKGAGTVEYV